MVPDLLAVGRIVQPGEPGLVNERDCDPAAGPGVAVEPFFHDTDVVRIVIKVSVAVQANPGIPLKIGPGMFGPRNRCRRQRDACPDPARQNCHSFASHSTLLLSPLDDINTATAKDAETAKNYARSGYYFCALCALGDAGSKIQHKPLDAVA